MGSRDEVFSLVVVAGCGARHSEIGDRLLGVGIEMM